MTFGPRLEDIDGSGSPCPEQARFTASMARRHHALEEAETASSAAFARPVRVLPFQLLSSTVGWTSEAPQRKLPFLATFSHNSSL